MLSTMDPPIRATTLAEDLVREIEFAPTKMITEAGIIPIETRPEPPSAMLVALMEDPIVLFTGIEWSAMALAAQIACLVAIDLPTDRIGSSDVLDALPEQSKLWLTGWQQQVNNGSCWCTSGSIGRQASDLIDAGYLLLAKREVTDWIGQPMPTRERVQAGSPGSLLFVRTMMGERYLEWIGAID